MRHRVHFTLPSATKGVPFADGDPQQQRALAGQMREKTHFSAS